MSLFGAKKSFSSTLPSHFFATVTSSIVVSLMRGLIPVVLAAVATLPSMAVAQGCPT